MKSVFKKTIVSLSLFTVLFTAMPQKKAEAGIILAPAGVGIFILVWGILANDMLLVILDDASAQSKIAAQMQAKYGHLSSNAQAFEGLAGMVAAKIPGNSVEEIELKFSKKEIVSALGTSAANRALVDAVYADLK